jgi:DNA-directed RNA polymerase specialized sigma24 family protein
MSKLTRLLLAIDRGDPRASDELLPLVYDELRKLAAAKLASERPGQTLQPTALVHEAYLRLVGGGEVGGQKSEVRDQKSNESTNNPTSDLRSLTCGPSFDSRGHFFAAAAEAMRRILVETARRKQRLKRGGKMARVELPDVAAAVAPGDEELLTLDEALSRLANVRPQAAELVKLRFFAGLGAEEAAAALGISARSGRRLWVFAQAWLRREMDLLDDRQSR